MIKITILQKLKSLIWLFWYKIFLWAYGWEQLYKRDLEEFYDKKFWKQERIKETNELFNMQVFWIKNTSKMRRHIPYSSYEEMLEFKDDEAQYLNKKHARRFW